MSETLETRLNNAEQKLTEATLELDNCRTALYINQRIETANQREIVKMKRHIAELQRKAPAPNQNGKPQPTPASP